MNRALSIIIPAACLLLLLTWPVRAAGFGHAAVSAAEQQRLDAALIHAAESDRLSQAKALLNGGANVNAEHGRALSDAAGKGYFHMVALLLKYGADPNKLEEWEPLGKNALMAAAEKGNIRIVKLLLKHGAKVDFKNNDGRTALYYAVSSSYSVTRLLVDLGADVNVRTYEGGDLPLVDASASGQARVVKLLLERGAKVNLQEGGMGLSPLMMARNFSTSKVLIDYGADMNMRDSIDKDTALIRALDEHRGKVARLLIRKGADVNAVDDIGETALKIARRKHEYGLIRLLRAAGARR